MAIEINFYFFYQQLVADISNSNCWYQQLWIKVNSAGHMFVTFCITAVHATLRIYSAAYAVIVRCPRVCHLLVFVETSVNTSS